MYSSAYIWGRIISALEKQLTVPVVSSYLDDAEIVEVTDTTIVLYTPSEYRKEMILGRFSLYIKEAMRELFDRDVELEVLSGSEADAYRTSHGQEEPFMFNPQFTFDRFVVGSSNRFAHAAAVACGSMETEGIAASSRPAGLNSVMESQAIRPTTATTSVSRMTPRIFRTFFIQIPPYLWYFVPAWMDSAR